MYASTHFIPVIALAIACLTPSAWSQVKKPASLAELTAYNGSDRQQRLLAGQKIFGDLDFANPDKDSGLNRFYPERGLTSAQYDDQMNRWLELLGDNGRK